MFAPLRYAWDQFLSTAQATILTFYRQYQGQSLPNMLPGLFLFCDEVGSRYGIPDCKQADKRVSPIAVVGAPFGSGEWCGNLPGPGCGCRGSAVLIFGRLLPRWWTRALPKPSDANLVEALPARLWHPQKGYVRP